MFHVILPLGTPVASGDCIEWAGRTLEVGGSPSTWPGPAGHIELTAVEMRG